MSVERLIRRLVVALLLLVCAPIPVAADDFTLSWDRPSGAGTAPAGYRLRYGPWPGPVTDEQDVGSTTSARVSGLDMARAWHFHVVAYDSQGLESPPSNHIVLRLPAADPVVVTRDFPVIDVPVSGRVSGHASPAYLSEGIDSPQFQTTLAVAHAGDTLVDATVWLRDDDGFTHGRRYRLSPMSQVELSSASVRRAPGAFGLAVTSSGPPVAVARTVTWNGGAGGHTELAHATPAPEWYFAEGATHGPFELFYLLFNPGSQVATVDVTYLRGDGDPIVRTYELAPASRLTVWVDQEAPELSDAEVAAVVRSRDGRPIVAERAMYLAHGGSFVGGHASLGVPAPRHRWLMAEGATGRFFSLYMLLANPSARDAVARLSFTRPDGEQVVTDVVVEPFTRRTIDVAAVDDRLRDTTVWTEVTSMNGTPVVAERAMWWPGTSWTDGHAAAGQAEPARRWLAAGGRTGGASRHATYLLLANVDDEMQQVRVTVLGPHGPLTSADLTVPARSRFNVDMASMFPTVTGSYGVLVSAVGGAGELVVEQSVYWDAHGQRWAAGTAAPALPLE